MLSTHWFVPVCCLPLLLTITGCSEPVEPIESYSVPKQDAVYAANHIDRAEAKPAKGRMLVAMIIDGPKTWYFKLMGPDEQIAERLDAFTNLIGSIEFKDGVPAWKNPAGWKQLPDDHPKNTGFVPRHATILIDPADNDSPELTVTQLPTAITPRPGKTQKELLDEFILINVNRWRVDQLRLKPATLATLYKTQEPGSKEPVEEVVKKVLDGRTLVFVHLTGTLPTPGGGRGPFMGMNR